MAQLTIPQQRLFNQRIIGTPFEKPDEAVRWLGAVQTQDYSGAKWALALRTGGATDAGLDEAFNRGAFLRTHVLRPTWHFVHPADIRWMLKLTAPLVHAVNAYYYRQCGLDEAAFVLSNATLEKTLQGGKHLTRDELAKELEQAGFTGGLLHFTLLMMRAELDAVICSGSLRGKQHTYALLEERVPPARELTYEESLAELTRRYFRSHGPALLKDFCWWSGLKATEAKTGLELVKDELVQEKSGDLVYWRPANALPAITPEPGLTLLPDFDEYTVAYNDRRDIYDPSQSIDWKHIGNSPLNYAILINGHFVGTWKRTIKKREVLVEAHPFRPFSDEEKQAFVAATEQYGRFIGLPVRLTNEVG